LHEFAALDLRRLVRRPAIIRFEHARAHQSFLEDGPQMPHRLFVHHAAMVISSLAVS